MLTRSLRNLLVGAVVGAFGLTSGLAVNPAYAAQTRGAPTAHATTAKKHHKARKHTAKHTTKKHRKAVKHTHKHQKAKASASAKHARA